MGQRNKDKECHAVHGSKVVGYYDTETTGLYLTGWNRDHIHFGLFEPGECPKPNEWFTDCEIHARAMVRMVEATVVPAEIEQQYHVVDAGCGVGGAVIHLARTRGCRATGVNIVPLHLEIATRKAAEAGLEDLVSFEYADCSQHLPFPDNSVDVVLNIESACHYIDRRNFLREVHRILKPSGKIVATDWMARDGLTDAEYERYIEPICEPYALPSLECPASYREILAEAGLEVRELEDFHGKDAANVQIVENACKLMAGLMIGGIRTPELHRLYGQVQPLHEAWSGGYFELRRYCAQKAA